MKYVLDVNVALKWVLNEVDSPKARRLRDDGRAQVHELITADNRMVTTLKPRFPFIIDLASLP